MATRNVSKGLRIVGGRLALGRGLCGQGPLHETQQVIRGHVRRPCP
jgi:hypothetical protein